MRVVIFVEFLYYEWHISLVLTHPFINLQCITLYLFRYNFGVRFCDLIDPETAPGLRQTLSCLMMDACTGKVCSMQRVATLGGRWDLSSAANRFFNGPLGASHGGDNGSALFLSPNAFPAVVAVNDGARRGLKLLNRAGRDNSVKDRTVTRIAIFATNLWRTINGESLDKSKYNFVVGGVCAYDSHLRSSLLALLQWIWPKGCIAVLRVQSWKSHEGTQRYKDLGAHHVMKMTDEERQAAGLEDALCEPLRTIVSTEVHRQEWRHTMAQAAYKHRKQLQKQEKQQQQQQQQQTSKPPLNDPNNKQGIGEPLPIVRKDTAWKLGGWVASTAQQRRAKGADGGTAVTKIRLTVKSGENNS